jgi:hypothetical protein
LFYLRCGRFAGLPIVDFIVCEPMSSVVMTHPRYFHSAGIRDSLPEKNPERKQN